MRNNTLEKILNIDLLFAGTALVILVIVTFMGVIMRYFINDPIIWQEEIQLFCFAWITFWGGGAVFRNGGHIAIDVLVDLFPEKIRKIIDIIVYVIVLLILLFLFRQSFILVTQYYVTKRITNILGIQYCIIYGALPLCCVLMIVNYSIAVYKKLKGGEKL